MRLVVQRVRRALVSSGEETLGEIGHGAVVLAGVATSDTPELVDRIADRLVGLRYFPDAEGRTNLSVAESGGALLVVSQFTLLAELRRGRRPGFSAAAPPEQAAALVERFIARIAGQGLQVESGRFGAEMEVELVNDGPFTLVFDSERDLPGR